MFRTLVVCVVTVALAVGLFGCKGKAAQQGTGNTPEKAKQGMLEATKGKGMFPEKADKGAEAEKSSKTE